MIQVRSKSWMKHIMTQGLTCLSLACLGLLQFNSLKYCDIIVVAGTFIASGDFSDALGTALTAGA
jgi:hypothetical protein